MEERIFQTYRRKQARLRLTNKQGIIMKNNKNTYGLDVPYFRKNLERILRDIDCYSQDEMFRALTVLAEVAEK